MDRWTARAMATCPGRSFPPMPATAAASRPSTGTAAEGSAGAGRSVSTLGTPGTLPRTDDDRPATMNRMTQPHSGTAAFRAARDLLLRHREDFGAAAREFSWPQLSEFNRPASNSHRGERP